MINLSNYQQPSKDMELPVLTSKLESKKPWIEAITDLAGQHPYVGPLVKKYMLDATLPEMNQDTTKLFIAHVELVKSKIPKSLDLSIRGRVVPPTQLSEVKKWASELTLPALYKKLVEAFGARSETQTQILVSAQIKLFDEFKATPGESLDTTWARLYLIQANIYELDQASQFTEPQLLKT